MSAITHPPDSTSRVERGSGAGRRFGYLVAIAINVVLIYLVNVSPGWASVSWLTPATTEIVPILNVSLTAGIVVNALFILADPPWFKALGDTVTCAVAVVVTGRLLQVFPFDFTAYSVDWATVVRVGLVVVLIAVALATVVNIVRFFVALARRS